MPFTTLSPQETSIVARLIRIVREVYDDRDDVILRAINDAAYSATGTEAGDFTEADLQFLEGKVSE